MTFYSFEWIKCGEGAIRKEEICSERGSAFYANHVAEVARKTKVMNVYEYEYETKDKNGNVPKVRFKWVTTLELDYKNIEEMLSLLDVGSIEKALQP